MPTITIQDLPPALLLRLAAAAAANGRGLNGEIIAQLARAADAGALGTGRPGASAAAGAGARTGWGGPPSGAAV